MTPAFDSRRKPEQSGLLHLHINKKSELKSSDFLFRRFCGEFCFAKFCGDAENRTRVQMRFLYESTKFSLLKPVPKREFGKIGIEQTKSNLA